MFNRFRNFSCFLFAAHANGEYKATWGPATELAWARDGTVENFSYIGEFFTENDG